MNKTIKTTLGEVCDFIGGSQPAKKFFLHTKKEGYVRLIQIRDYKTDSYITYIPEESTRKFCNKTDIMIGRYGPPIFQILRGIKGAYNVALMKAIPKNNIANSYLYYFLTQEYLFDYVNALSPRTGGQTGVDVVMLKKFPIQLPELETQKKIAKVLSDLDGKIEINNKINQELEAMAKTLYDYWFVQFDFPDANGKPYKFSGGKMIFNEALKREIPEGWEKAELQDIANITMGQSPLGTSYNEESIGSVFYQGCTDFGSRYPTNRKYTTKPTRFAKEADILLSVRAPVGTMNIANEYCQ
jgi:type I restriction enzyme S subunit